MGIWFYLFLIALFFLILLMIKIISMKKEIKNIEESLSTILHTDTNNVITVTSNDKELSKLATSLNHNLKRLRSLELEYKQGSRELKSSIVNISHDLRTPLTAIRGYLDLMDNHNLNKKQLKYVRIMDRKVKDLTELTEQLFDFSKSLDIEEHLEKENVCLNYILEDTILSFYGLFKEHHINPTIEICDKKIIRSVNETMVKRIFENIISNAIKYSENDFTIQLKESGMIEFSNKTALLDHTSLEKMFDRYYTVKSVKKSNGIGLSIAKQLVELNHGKIKAIYQNNYLTIQVIF